MGLLNKAMRKSSLKILPCLSAFFFTAAFLTFAFHYDRYGFQLSNCSICSIKDSTPLSFHKVKSDCGPAALMTNLPCLINVFPKLQEILLTPDPVGIPSLLSDSVANKASPIFS